MTPAGRNGRGWRRAAALLASAAALGGAVAAPAIAQESENLGGGVATGSIAFSPAVQLGGGCQGTDFTISGSSPTAVINTAIVGYVGPVQLTGTGRDSCPSGFSHSGAFELTASGINPVNGGTLDCDLDGTYTRLGTLAAVTTSGICEINGGFAADVTFVAEVAVVPNQLSPIRTASFVAPFTVSP